MSYFLLSSEVRKSGRLGSFLLAILLHTQSFAAEVEQNRERNPRTNPFQRMTLLENEPEAPWDPRPQRIRPPSVGNRGAIRIPAPSPGFQIGRPDLKYDRNNLRTGPSTPSKRKIYPLSSNHPSVSNRRYNSVTKRTLYVPVRLDYDHETDLAIAELERLIDIQKRNGKNEILCQLIKEAKDNIKKAKRNAVAAGNYFVNGVHIDKLYPEKDFPKPEDLIMRNFLSNG